MINYLSYIQARISEKKLFKETKLPKHKSFDETFKLALNGGTFGKLGEVFNWQNDPYILMCITIGNQFEILMLIEMLETEGIHVVSANTDGIVCLFDKDLESKYNEICNNWEKIVGNDVNGRLEFADYSFLAQTSVNDYIAQTTKGEVKKKGDFMTEFELHKNKSKAIIPIALENYFIYNIPIEDTVMYHENIYDYCAAVKGNSDSTYYLIDQKTGSKTKVQKINRYYISNSNTILIKELPKLENKIATNQIDIFGDIDTGERITRIEADQNITIFNKYEQKPMLAYQINYQYYINECYKIINKIKNE